MVSAKHHTGGRERLVPASLVGASLSGCARNPVTGQNQLSLWYLTECPDTIMFDWFTITLRDNTTGTTTTLLARTCTPCHVPGGRMYERLPFDRADVVLAHKDRILRRLKNPDDRAVLERWLAGQPPG